MRQAFLADRRLPLLLALVLFAIAPFFINLGASSLWDSNEAFYAETPREMLEADDWLNPTFNYKPRFNKPPLCYWVVAVSYKIFGVSERAERLPLAAGALVMIVTALLLGSLAHSPTAGLLAALALATVPRFVMFSRRIIIDVYIAMFMGLTLLFFALAEKYPEKRRLYLSLMYVAAALGVLTKGPVAVVLPGLAFLLYLAATRQLAKLRMMMLPAGALIVAAIVLPWYLAIYAEHGWQYISSFLLRDNLSRYTEPVWGPRRGYFFYLPVMLGDLFPWSLMLFAALAGLALPRLRRLAHRLWRRLRAVQPDAEPPPVELSPLDRQSQLLLVWVAVIVVFYSLSSNKEDLYIAPIYAAAAALVGVWLARWLDAGAAAGGDYRRWLLFGTGLLLAGLGAAVGFFFGSTAAMYDLSGALLIGWLALVGGLLVAALAFGRRRFAAVAALGLVFAALNWLFVWRTLPDFERYKPVRALCEVIESEAPAEALVGYYRVASPSMVFYLRRQIFEYYQPEELLAAFASGRPVYCLMSDDDYEAIKESLPQTTRILASRPVFQVKLRTLLSPDNRGVRDNSDQNSDEPDVNDASGAAPRKRPQVVLIANK